MCAPSTGKYNSREPFFANFIVRLVGLIHKMMLQETGPRVVPDKAHQANCVSPYVIDVAYKLLYSAPCA